MAGRRGEEQKNKQTTKWLQDSSNLTVYSWCGGTRTSWGGLEVQTQFSYAPGEMHLALTGCAHALNWQVVGEGEASCSVEGEGEKQAWHLLPRGGGLSLPQNQQRWRSGCCDHSVLSYRCCWSCLLGRGRWTLGLKQLMSCLSSHVSINHSIHRINCNHMTFNSKN